MEKRKLFCLIILLTIANVSLACDKHNKRIAEEAGNKLLKIVPNLETAECAHEALMKIAVKLYIPEHVCYQMTEEEYNKAKKIATKKKTLAALKAMDKEETDKIS